MDLVKLLKTSQYYDSIGNHELSDKYLKRFAQFNAGGVIANSYKLDPKDVNLCTSIIDFFYSKEVSASKQPVNPNVNEDAFEGYVGAPPGLTRRAIEGKIFYMPSMIGNLSDINPGSGQFETRPENLLGPNEEGVGADEAEQIQQIYRKKGGSDKNNFQMAKAIQTFIKNYLDPEPYSNKNITYITDMESAGDNDENSESLLDILKNELANPNGVQIDREIYAELADILRSESRVYENQFKQPKARSAIRSSFYKIYTELKKNAGTSNTLDRAVVIQPENADQPKRSGLGGIWDSVSKIGREMVKPQKAYVRYISISRAPNSPIGMRYAALFQRISGRWMSIANKIQVLTAAGYSIGACEGGRLIDP